jgi:hypothetical protein
LLFLLLAVFLPPLNHSVFQSHLFRAADASGADYVDASFKRALVAFALARTANAIISVIQGSELDVAPAGVGMTIAIGEALDPLNDMVERFSWIMLLSLVSLGVQKILLEMVPWFSLYLVLVPALLVLLAGIWWPWGNRRLAVRLGSRLLLLALLLRFCVPVTAWCNDQLYNRFLAMPYTAAIGEFEQGNALLQTINPLPAVSGATPDGGFFNRLKENAQRLTDAANLQRQLEVMKAHFGRLIEQLLTIIVVFLLNSVLLPVGFLWLTVMLGRWLLSGLVSVSLPAEKGTVVSL